MLRSGQLKAIAHCVLVMFDACCFAAGSYFIPCCFFFHSLFFFFFSPLYGLWPLLTVEWTWKVNLLWDCRLLFWNPAWNLTFSIFFPEFVLLLHGIAWLSFGFAVAGRTGRQRWQNLNHLYSETWIWKRSSSPSCHAVSQKHQTIAARWQSSTSLVFRF